MFELHLGGHLNFYTPHKRARFNLPVERSKGLKAVLCELGVPLCEVAIVSINGKMVELDSARVVPGDKVDLFPPMGGG
jgi:molybdopterin converting factor small subunit